MFRGCELTSNIRVWDIFEASLKRKSRPVLLDVQKLWRTLWEAAFLPRPLLERCHLSSIPRIIIVTLP